jgi:nitroreductase
MSGIVFYKTQKLAELRDFYVNQVECDLWLEQEDCIILRHGNLLFGLCERDEPHAEKQGLLTFFYGRKDDVDRAYERFRTVAASPPSLSDKYRVYQFFAHDPEGRMLEFQYFDHPISGYLSGEQLLLTRRSVREFIETAIPDAVLNQVLETCRYAPTSRNTQSYYFKVIRDRELIASLAAVRDKSTAPIGRAATAVAIVADPVLSKRHVQDGCIAAYHFMLAAWFFGLGTCWIAAMDREEVKRLLDIPDDHYVATVTPVGYPAGGLIDPPARKDVSWFVR